MVIPFETTSVAQILWDDEHHIGRVVYDPVDLHDAAEAIEITEALDRLRQSRGLENLRILVDMRSIGALTRGAREVYGGPHVERNRAAALVVGSVTSRVVANFFLGLNKPKAPVRMFTDISAALTWLGEFRHG